MWKLVTSWQDPYLVKVEVKSTYRLGNILSTCHQRLSNFTHYKAQHQDSSMWERDSIILLNKYIIYLVGAIS